MISRISRSISAVGVLFLVFYVHASVALAQSSGGASDPTKIGDRLKGIVQPNAKGLWWVLLIVGLLAMVSSRRAGRAVAGFVMIVASGVCIWNPGGVGSLMSGFAEKLLPG